MNAHEKYLDLETIRKMPLEEKLKMCFEVSAMVREDARTEIQNVYPDISKGEVEAKLRERIDQDESMHRPLTFEDWVVVKLKWYKDSISERHYLDALSIYELQKDNLDIKYIDRWTKYHRCYKLFKDIKENKLLFQ